MSMSNLLIVDGVALFVMKSKERTTIGMAHPTVIPRNFEPERERCPECGRPTDGEDRLS